MPAKKVLEFLKMDPPEEGGGFKAAPAKKGRGNEWQGGDEQTLSFAQGNDDIANDLFT